MASARVSAPALFAACWAAREGLAKKPVLLLCIYCKVESNTGICFQTGEQRRFHEGMHDVCFFVLRCLQMHTRRVAARSLTLLTSRTQAASRPDPLFGLAETLTMISAFCLFIYSLLLFYNGSIEYFSTRIQPHP